MKYRMLAQFSASPNTSSGERLLTLRQEGLASNAPELPDAVLEMAFMIRLKPQIRARVKTFEPRHLEKMMSMAKRVEDWGETEEESQSYPSGGHQKGDRGGQSRNSGENGGKSLTRPNNQRPNNPKTTNGFGSSKAHNQHKGNDSRNPNTHNRVRPPFRRLTAEEIAQHKANNLCFRCDEKWHYRHLYPRQELQLLLVMTDRTEIEWEDDGEREEHGEHEVTQMAELSLNSLVGISSRSRACIRIRLTEGVMESSGTTRGRPSIVRENIRTALNYMGYRGKVTIHAYGRWELWMDQFPGLEFHPTCLPAGTTKEILLEFLLSAIPSRLEPKILMLIMGDLSKHMGFIMAIQALKKRKQKFNPLLVQPRRASGVLLDAITEEWHWTCLVNGYRGL